MGDSNVARDKITKLEITSSISGHEPEACDTTSLYFDDLYLERVDPDYVEGWPVWNERISYSHTGYLPEAPKTALASNLNATEFKIVDEKSGQTVLTKPVKSVLTKLGTFNVLDFSEIRESGSYKIVAGETKTDPFRVDPDVWEASIRKALNFFMLNVAAHRFQAFMEHVTATGPVSMVIKESLLTADGTMQEI